MTESQRKKTIQRFASCTGELRVLVESLRGGGRENISEVVKASLACLESAERMNKHQDASINSYYANKQ